MRALVMLVLVGCGPYASSNLGRTCDAGAQVNHCASPTTYAACDGADFKVWREYPCQDACGEGKSCDLAAAKHGTACPATWEGVQVCKSSRLSIGCSQGTWVQHGCAPCPAGEVCYDFACACG